MAASTISVRVVARAAAVELTDDGVRARRGQSRNRRLRRRARSPSRPPAPRGLRRPGRRQSTRAGDDDDAGLVARAGNQCDQRVVDDERPRLEADAPHDAAHGGGVATHDRRRRCRDRWPPAARPDRRAPVSITACRTFSTSSSPDACRFAPPPRASDTTCPCSSASRQTVFVPPASIPRTCMSISMVHSGRGDTLPLQEPPPSSPARHASRAFPAAVIEVGTSAQAAGVTRLGSADLRDRRTGRCGRHDLRPGFADQGAGHDAPCHASGRARPARPRRSSLQSSAVMARRRSRVRDPFATCWRTAVACRRTSPSTARSRSRRHRARHLRPPLEYAPRSRSVYSDLGFMLLGFILEDIAPLDAAVRRAARPDAESRGTAVPPAGDSGSSALRRRDGATWRGSCCSSAKWTTTIRGRSAARRARRALFGTAAAVGGYAPPFMQVLCRTVGVVPARDDAPVRPRAEPTCRAVRGRSGGTRCCRRRRAEPGCPQRHSGIRASREHHSGSIPSTTSMWCC